MMFTGFITAAIYSFLLLFPIIYWTNTFSVDLMDVASPIRLTFVGLCGTATLAVGIVPQVYISLAIHARRRTTMLGLLRKLHTLTEPGDGSVLDEAERLRSRFDAVAASPASTLGSANLVQILVGITAAAVPFIATVFLGR